MELLGKILKYFSCVMLVFLNLNALFERKPLYPTYIPGISRSSKPFFWIIFIYQIPEMYLALFFLNSYIHSTLTFIMFGTAQIQILNYKLSLLSLTKDEFDSTKTNAVLNPVLEQKKAERRLRKNCISCIEFHLQIKKFV